MKNKFILSLLTFLVVISPFSKAEETSSRFKIADSQINELFNVKDDDSLTLGGAKLHNFTITCKKDVLELMALQKGVMTPFNEFSDRTISIDIPSIALKCGEVAHIALELRQQQPPLIGVNMATFDSKKFDSMLSKDPSQNPLSKPMDTIHGDSYFTALLTGEAQVPFFITDNYSYNGFAGPILKSYNLDLNVAVRINAAETTETTSE
ncbi:MAG: hypothetical protein K2W99_00015 [Chthoniobacterales bacterium]|nr:hypothetical protein [Chthoniobacterales bacterium]